MNRFNKILLSPGPTSGGGGQPQGGGPQPQATPQGGSPVQAPGSPASQGTPQQGGGPKSGKVQGSQPASGQQTTPGKIPWGPLEDQLPTAERVTDFDKVTTIHSRHVQPIEADDPKKLTVGEKAESEYYSKVYSVDPATKAKASKTFTVHIEGHELIRLFGTYGPIYSVEISADNLFALLQERHVVTDPATRKRYIIHEGKPKLED